MGVMLPIISGSPRLTTGGGPNPVVLDGPQGPHGAAGDAGPDGFPGANGANGSNGAAGTPAVLMGVGDPNGSVAGVVGNFYHDTDSGLLWLKSTNGGNLGWI